MGSKEDILSYRAMYIWSDGTEPTPLLRSKTHIFPDGKDPVVWGFDGSSTMQAPGDESDPSNPQTTGSFPSGKMWVLERNKGVGSVPSDQMYMAR